MDPSLILHWCQFDFATHKNVSCARWMTFSLWSIKKAVISGPGIVKIYDNKYLSKSISTRPGLHLGHQGDDTSRSEPHQKDKQQGLIKAQACGLIILYQARIYRGE